MEWVKRQFVDLLATWGKKALVAGFNMLVTAGLAAVNKKWNLGLTLADLALTMAPAAVYVPSQAYVDAKTGGLTSSLKGTPQWAPPAISYLKSGMSPPAQEG